MISVSKFQMNIAQPSIRNTATILFYQTAPFFYQRK